MFYPTYALCLMPYAIRLEKKVFFPVTSPQYHIPTLAPKLLTMKPYLQADAYLHVASQVLAKLNRAFVAQQPDDCHTNLRYKNSEKRIYGRRIMVPDAGLQFVPSIHLPTMTLEMVHPTTKSIVASLSMAGKPISEFNDELAAWLKEHTLETLIFRENMHYDIPDYGIESYRALTNEELTEWHEGRKQANELLDALATKLAQTDKKSRIWPHHFDTGIYVKLESGVGIGAGFAMKDKYCNEPYFYLAVYSDEHEFPSDTKLTHGLWVSDERFNGAVIAFPSNHVEEFFAEVLTAYGLT